MDLAEIIKRLLGHYNSMQPQHHPSSQIYSDSQGMPPEWYLSQQHPALHQQMFPQETGGLVDQMDQKNDFSTYQMEMLQQYLQRMAQKKQL